MRLKVWMWQSRSTLGKFAIHSFDKWYLCVHTLFMCVFMANVLVLMCVVISLPLSLFFNACLWHQYILYGRVNGKKWLMAVSAFSSQRAYFLYFLSFLFNFICMTFNAVHIELDASCSLLYHRQTVWANHLYIHFKFLLAEKKQRYKNENNNTETKHPIWSSVDQGSKQSRIHKCSKAWQIRKLIKRCR